MQDPLPVPGLVGTPADRLARLPATRAKIAAHHRVMAVFMPQLLGAWNELHHTVTGAAALSRFELNFVWIVVVAAARIPTGSGHVRSFLEAGGTRQQIEAAAVLGALALGSAAVDTIETGWLDADPQLALKMAQAKAGAAIARDAGIELLLAHLAMSAAAAACGFLDRLPLHLRAAVDAGASDEAIAQALSLTIMPAGMPAFLRACTVWLKMADAGELRASPELLAAARYEPA